MLSAYEKARLRTIAENHKVLEGLGLEPHSQQRVSKKRTRPSPPAPHQSAVRRSSRVLPGASARDVAAQAAREQLSDVPPWEVEAFNSCESAVSGAVSGSPGSAWWDATKHHQHLVISSSGRAVATTGVAGYGAALARKAPGCKRWSVRAVRFGVGGFGVGLVKASMKAPFKSIGRSAHGLGCYLASGMLATEAGERPFGPAYQAGDLVEVLLRPTVTRGVESSRVQSQVKSRVKSSRDESCQAQAKELSDVVFLLNGAEVGVVAHAVPAGSVALAVQPYMGGVALLES